MQIESINAYANDANGSKIHGYLQGTNWNWSPRCLRKPDEEQREVRGIKKKVRGRKSEEKRRRWKKEKRRGRSCSSRWRKIKDCKKEGSWSKEEWR